MRLVRTAAALVRLRAKLRFPVDPAEGVGRFVINKDSSAWLALVPLVRVPAA
jgi:hypothetical protein